MRTIALKRAGALFALGVLSFRALAGQFIVAPGGSIVFPTDGPSGSLVLSCADLVIQGSVSAGAATVSGVGDLRIAAGGELNGGSSSLSVGGGWSNAGTFNAGTGVVALVDGCSTSAAVISGVTAFSNWSLSSNAGRTFTIPPGASISVSGNLRATGTPEKPIQIVSSDPSQPSYIALGASAVVLREDAQLGPNVFIGAPSFPLTITRAGAGAGTVSSIPAGIDCGATCSASFDGGVAVMLTATPDAVSTFGGWSGDVCSGTGTCQVTMEAAKTVTATFTLNADSYSITTIADPSEGGSITCSPNPVTHGSTAMCTATASAGYVFTGWSGACSGVASPCTTGVATAPLSVRANFSLEPTAGEGRTIAVFKGGPGAGSIVSSPAGIDCGETCSATFPGNAQVILTATPAQGMRFAGWGGACVGLEACTLTVNAATAVHAYFAPVESSFMAGARVQGGILHSCLLSTDGGVRCWGAGDGRLGLPNESLQGDLLAPIPTPGLESGIAEIAVGWYTGCARSAQGVVKCWGADLPLKGPQEPVGLAPGVKSISGNTKEICAITADGAAKCWHKEVGEPPTFRQVSGLSEGAIQVAAGGFYSCALMAAGEVQCWGPSAYGQPSSGFVGDRPVPEPVSGITEPIQSVVGSWDFGHCATTTTGRIFCWSYDLAAEEILGLGGGALQLAMASGQVCAIRLDGRLFCRGGGNYYGQLGDGSRMAPGLNWVAPQLSGASAASVGLGPNHNCVILRSGQVLCSGNNSNGQLGAGIQQQVPEPIAVAAVPGNVTKSASGPTHACAVLSDGSVRCWGDNLAGQIGDGTQTDRPSGQAVLDVSSAIDIAVGKDFSCSLQQGGAVKCWGMLPALQSGEPNEGAPVTVRATVVSGLGQDVTGIAAGDRHVCARHAGGSVMCWGENGRGQVGDGTTANRSAPATVNGLPPVTHIAAGSEFTCALTSTGGVYCWGANDWGQIGDGTGVTQVLPVQVSGLASGFRYVGAGGNRACAINVAGDMQCWGRELVFGSARLTPQVETGWAASLESVDFGEHHQCVLSAGGTMQCRGLNSDGQVGVGYYGGSVGFPELVNNLNGVVAIDLGKNHSCAVKGTGELFCWGDNQFGQIGNGDRGIRTPPTLIALQNLIGFSVAGSGAGQITTSVTKAQTRAAKSSSSCSSACTELLDSGVALSVTATAASGSRFAGWGGFCRGADSTCSFVVDRPTVVVAQFVSTEATFPLTVAKDGTGSGSVTSTPAGIDCWSTCDAGFSAGATVTLAATAATGSTFAGWSGEGCSGTGACEVTMDAAKSVTATFTLNTYAITEVASPVGGGTVSCSPNPVSHGSDATCTATANSGYTFTGWSDGCSGSSSPCTTSVVTGPLTVTGSFRETVPPETTITSSPAALTNSTSASFGFSSNEANSTFECALDGGAYAACASPKAYTGLGEGAHSFSVRATDQAGNVDATPAGYTWTVDTTAPTVAINTPTAIATANQVSYSVGGTCSEAGRTVSVSVGAVTGSATCTTGAWSVSGLNVSALADGTVTISASQTDAAGNTGAASTTAQKSTSTNVVITNQTLTGVQAIVARGVLTVGPGIVIGPGADVVFVAGDDVVIVQPLSIAPGARFEIIIDRSLANP